MFDTNDVIDLLRFQSHHVTIYDCGEKEVKFCLAVKVDEPTDLYYLGRLLSWFYVGPPYLKDGFAYFPEIEINAETYSYILAKA